MKHTWTITSWTQTQLLHKKCTYIWGNIEQTWSKLISNLLTPRNLELLLVVVVAPAAIILFWSGCWLLVDANGFLRLLLIHLDAVASPCIILKLCLSGLINSDFVVTISIFVLGNWAEGDGKSDLLRWGETAKKICFVYKWLCSTVSNLVLLFISWVPWQNSSMITRLVDIWDKTWEIDLRL